MCYIILFLRGHHCDGKGVGMMRQIGWTTFLPLLLSGCLGGGRGAGGGGDDGVGDCREAARRCAAGFVCTEQASRWMCMPEDGGLGDGAVGGDGAVVGDAGRVDADLSAPDAAPSRLDGQVTDADPTDAGPACGDDSDCAGGQRCADASFFWHQRGKEEWATW